MLDEQGSVPSVVFLVYIIFFVVVAWNIVTSIFIQKALKISKPDPESIMVEQLKDEVLLLKELSKRFMYSLYMYLLFFIFM